MSLGHLILMREKKPVVSYADVEHSDCDASDSEAQYAEQQQARGYVPVVPRRRQDDAERALIARDGAWADAYVALYATAGLRLLESPPDIEL